MKILHSWLSEFIPGLDIDPHALGDVMSGLGLCCEEVRLLGGGLDGIVVARVLGLAPHPDADRIQVVQVDAGDGEALQICCGAFNMAVGDLVPLATLGTTMPSGLEIARRKLRGEWSNGMLCSAAELELADDAAGIMILPAGAVPGTPLVDALGIEPDALYDLDLTPNRPDALSVIGVARDVAAKLGLTLVLPSTEVATSGVPAGELATIDVMDSGLCGRFTARVLSKVSVGPSPAWMARRLTLSGMRPINSVVDISNYVMLEYGQPNHTYDLAEVAGPVLRVRRSPGGETIGTLDGVTRTLAPGDGVIADGHDRPVGIAGVMGGASTEISATTTDVLLELAWWDPASIGATSQRLGLRSEASSRFDKGVDPGIASAAAARFAQLAVEQGAVLHPGEIVVDGELPAREPVLVRTARVNAVLGSDLDRDTIAGYLDPIGFTATPSGEDLTVQLPTWRPDSVLEIDVIEEVARHHGYDRLGKTVPSSGARRGRLTDDQLTLRQLKATLVAQGASEAKPMPFLAPGDLERFGLRSDAVIVTNPLVTEESVLRTSLLPGLVGSVATNAAHRNTGVSLFEVGHCYALPAPGTPMPREWNELGVALAGRSAVDAVGWANAAVASVGRAAPTVTSAVVPGLHPTRAAVIRVGEVMVGELGEVDPAVAESAGVAERLAWVRLDLDALLGIPAVEIVAAPVSRYPSSDIDLAFVVPAEIAAHRVAGVLAAGHRLVSDVQLFDVFRSDALGDGARSLAFAVRLQADDRTLTDADVAEARTALITAAAGLGAELRG